MTVERGTAGQVRFSMAYNRQSFDRHKSFTWARSQNNNNAPVADTNEPSLKAPCSDENTQRDQPVYSLPQGRFDAARGRSVNLVWRRPETTETASHDRPTGAKRERENASTDITKDQANGVPLLDVKNIQEGSFCLPCTLPHKKPMAWSRRPSNTTASSSHRAQKDWRASSHQSGRAYGCPPAKRIRLIDSQAPSKESVVSLSNDSSPQERTNSTLTEFAYRVTSNPVPPQVQRHYSRTHNNRRNQIHNTGLVRVKTDKMKTPVCQSFLKGIPCNDVRCLKRHDLPPEAVLPICSFFQRNGQCLRPACPFRHVKVNPRTAVCPTFVALGYCDDNTCDLKHVRKFSAS